MFPLIVTALIIIVRARMFREYDSLTYTAKLEIDDKKSHITGKKFHLLKYSSTINTHTNL